MPLFRYIFLNPAFHEVLDRLGSDIGLISCDFIMSAGCWKDVHHFLKTLPVDWDFTIPYSLIYAKEPAKELLQFIMAIGNVL